VQPIKKADDVTGEHLSYARGNEVTGWGRKPEWYQRSCGSVKKAGCEEKCFLQRGGLRKFTSSRRSIVVGESQKENREITNTKGGEKERRF